jgi:hypothetical protein
MATLPQARELFGGDPSICDGNSDPHNPHGKPKPGKLVTRHEELIKAMTAATAEGVSGGVAMISQSNESVPLIKSRKRLRAEMQSTLDNTSGGVVAKGVSNETQSLLSGFLSGPSAATLAKEWTLSTPISTGLVAYDLEAPAKLIAPRPTPFRNSIPRLRGQGASRRFKVINGFTGTGTGGNTTTQTGFTETTTNAGPGGLAYIRPPQMSYSGYDVVQSYVSQGLSDSVSWQAEWQGQGYEDIRSLSHTTLLYATMLMEERMICYGRGTTGNGYTGALGTPSNITVAATSASVTTQGSSTLPSGNVFVLVAADAGDLLSVAGAMHQGPTSTLGGGGGAASVNVSAGQAVQVNIGTDVAGALGYNLFAASVAAGPYYYAGRTGSNVGYIVSQPSSGPQTTSGAGDQSAVATNYDGMFTNLAANGGYVKRLNAGFSTTNPGTEFQTAFATLYDATKADPDEVWLNGFDRLSLSNALLNNATTNAYRVMIDNNGGMGGVAVGAVVQTLMNEVTGKAVSLNVHPWFPQGNALVRSSTLPIPDSNVGETFAVACVQDYAAIDWVPVQFTWDCSTVIISTLCSYAPTWSGVIQGIQSPGVPQSG